VGWFTIAVIAGFLLFWSWRRHADEDQPKNLKGRAAQFSAFCAKKAHYVLIEILPATLLVLAIVATVLFFLGSYFALIDALDSYLADEIRSGYLARLLFGIILGFGGGYLIEQRSRGGGSRSKARQSRSTYGPRRPRVVQSHRQTRLASPASSPKLR
jgi:hypothetical protein